ncbi:UDP-N-acetylglucosamine 4-epimerase [Vibrio mediterranei]|uniref:NAD-dependent epimerase/dehydratase family protein n=1 Tax=Vibrio mediterranei TaxID=689 RepID=UPI000D1852DE|nr:NAD-dependent epimerase/dehydratase family protein [Vibrio mediterranei]PTC02968.1 UDP-N-acetylglucosamine 4-epimerase [Vibrio mediterranei]
MKILITGGSGFIGTRLIELLSALDGVELINYDKKISERFPDLTVIGDIRDLEALKQASNGVNVIYNLAAEHADNVTPSSLYRDVNVGGAENVVKVAEFHDIRKIIFTSTVAIYGLNRGMPTESLEPKPFNNYGHSKLEAERIFSSWQKRNSNTSLVTLRPAVVFGENNRGNVYNLINQIATGKFIMIGDGKNRKSMSYVGNIAEFLKLQLSNEQGHSVYNYADKADLSSEEIVSIVKREMNISVSSFKIPYAVGLAGGYLFDIVSKCTGKKFPVSAVRIQKFCADTTIDATSAMSSGFNAPYSLEEGLKRMIEHEFK